MALLDLTSGVHLTTFLATVPKQLKYSTFSGCLWPIAIYNADGGLISVFSTFTSNPTRGTVQFQSTYQSCPQHRPFLTKQHITSAYFTISHSEVSKPFNNLVDKVPSTSLSKSSSVFTLPITPWSNRTSALRSRYNLLIKSMWVPLRIRSHLVQSARSNARCQSMTQSHNCSSPSRVRPILFSAPELNPELLFLFPNETHLLRVHPHFLYDLLLSVLATICTVCAVLMLLSSS
jgi:hypothetical protein